MNLTNCIKGGDSQGRLGWILQFTYNIDFLEKFKMEIDYHFREWRPGNKKWWVSETYEAQLDALFGNWYALAKQQGVLL